MKKSLREAVVTRDKFCMKCGRAVTTDCAVHHRKLRSQGGPDSLSNLIALCHKCHNLGTESVHLNPAEAYRNGWIVRAHEDPAKVPVSVSQSRWVLLNDEGTYTEIKENE